MDPFPPIAADAEVHADENVCEPRERTCAITAIAIAFLLALGVTALSFRATPPGDLGGTAVRPPNGPIDGRGLGGGSGSGIGAGEGVGAGEDGEGAGAGDAGSGRLAEGPEERLPPPGHPDGAGTSGGAAVAAHTVPPPEPAAPRFGFTAPEAPMDARPAPGLPEGAPSSGSSGVAGGGGTGAELMGVKAPGTRVVYVLNRSLSMNRWFDRSLEELRGSLEGLPERARFSIALFGFGPPRTHRALPPQTWVRPTPAERRRALDWAREHGPRVADLLSEPDLRRNPVEAVQRNSVSNDPAAALAHALALRPDAIFLITDGQIDEPDKTLSLVRAPQAGRRTPIHVMLVDADSAIKQPEADNPSAGTRLLRTLAAETGGEFRVVDMRVGRTTTTP